MYLPKRPYRDEPWEQELVTKKCEEMFRPLLAAAPWSRRLKCDQSAELTFYACDQNAELTFYTKRLPVGLETCEKKITP